MIKLIIFGGRDFSNEKAAFSEIEKYLREINAKREELEFVSGCCDRGALTYTRNDGTKVFGADGLGEKFAMTGGYVVKLFPANWKKHGRAAGPIRNLQMGEYGTHGLGFWDKKSRGTKDMIEVCEKFGIIPKVINYLTNYKGI